MNDIKKTKAKKVSSEEYCQLFGEIYPQLKNLEKTMKQYSLNDSLHYIKLTQKSFEIEVVKELQTNQ